MQRSVLTALVGLLVVSAGCTGLITGDSVEFTANEVTVGEDALESTGYEAQNESEQTIEREISVGGQERTVRITNHYAVYARSSSVGDTEGPDIAQFAVISTPGAQMAGQTLNPLARLSNRELIDRVADRVGGVEDVEFVENRSSEALGSERDVGVFNGTASIEGQEFDVQIHVTSFEHEGDVIVAVGVHPVQIDEEENIDELLAGLEHSGSDG